MWSMLISFVVYIAAAWGASAYLKTQGLDAGFSKRVLVGCFAFVVSWLVGAGIDALFPSKAASLPQALSPASLSAPCLAASTSAITPARPTSDAPDLKGMALPCLGSASTAESQEIQAALSQALGAAKP